MKLLNTYEDREEAEKAEMVVAGKKRLASERDGTEVIYNLFGQPSWTNFHNLKMFNLPLLKQILEQRKAGATYDQTKHQEIISLLKYVARNFELQVPPHWE